MLHEKLFLGLNYGNGSGEHHRDEIIQRAETVALRQDMNALLSYVRDNKVIGTQSTGNFPLKDVREITRRFVNPPALETKIGNHVYKIRSEIELWPLWFLHTLADSAELLAINQSRRWLLTPVAELYLTRIPLSQLLFLFTIWCYIFDWLEAFPFQGMGDSLPPRFKKEALDQLTALPVKTPISVEDFSDKLIEKTGLTWSKPDSSSAHDLLRAAVKRMIIDVLLDFGAVEGDYRDEPLGNSTYAKLVSFEITPLGRACFESLILVKSYFKI